MSKLNIHRHLKDIENKTEKKQIENIDFIYLINLDKRPDRLEKCQRQFAPYQISPHRFPAIHGWDLTQETFDEIALPIFSTTVFDRPVHVSPLPGGASPHQLGSACIGKACVHYTMAAGALGVYLSHLSILMDAYRSHYQTIWVLEDDITVKKNPHQLIECMKQLDVLAPGWDILYTDNDDCFTSENVMAHMGGGRWGRPGVPMTDVLLEHQLMGAFIKIGGRCQAHSMIYRASGIKKIIDFIIPNGIFRPYDTEIPYVPSLTFYNSLSDIVHGRDRTFSDTFYKIP